MRPHRLRRARPKMPCSVWKGHFMGCLRYLHLDVVWVGDAVRLVHMVLYRRFVERREVALRMRTAPLQLQVDPLDVRLQRVT